MSLSTLLLASLLLVDPSGDAHGAGDLVPPTAEVYSSTAPFDLVEVEVLPRSTLTLRVRLADRPDPGGLANGITLPVLDLYVDSEEGGEQALLPGPGLRMPPERGWEVAVRVTGDAAFARRAADPGAVDHPVSVTADGNALVIATPFEAPQDPPVVHALTGVYDAFDDDAWRPLTQEPSPWAFSSETATFPVVDLLAEDDAAQQAALRSGVLPLGSRNEPAAPWLVLMVLGLVIALAGLVLRSRVGRRPDGADAVARDADEDETLDGEALDGEALESERSDGEAVAEDDPVTAASRADDATDQDAPITGAVGRRAPRRRGHGPVDGAAARRGRAAADASSANASLTDASPAATSPAAASPGAASARHDATEPLQAIDRKDVEVLEVPNEGADEVLATSDPSEETEADPSGQAAGAAPGSPAAWPDAGSWLRSDAEAADREAWPRQGEGWSLESAPDAAPAKSDEPAHAPTTEAKVDDVGEADLFDPHDEHGRARRELPHADGEPERS